ncbi:MAG: T9SS type A sorting domain-containing protein [Prevotellaceae bacterium]|jgi:hypothetical protein|nr:T9SS type A sorting domain-containing protein [Prevotellaceae bacterium]
MKRRYIIKLICLPFLCLCVSLLLPAQTVQTAWHGKISIGDSPVVMNGDMALQSDGELFTNDGRLEITGNYRGESGSKVFCHVPAGTQDLSLFLDVSGSAGGSTEIIPEIDAQWDGSPVELVKAKRDNADDGVFYIQPAIPDCGDYYVQLQHRTDGNRSFWSVAGTRTLPLIRQLHNHTLLVNNNRDTNGGHSFTYYKWYRDGQPLKEGSHTEYGGSYYTEGSSLDEDAVYMVEVTDTDGMRYFSCPYRYVPVALPINVLVYPNPVLRNSKATVQVETSDLSLLNDASVEIYDLLGQLTGRTDISGQTLSSVAMPAKTGIYILKFRAKDYTKTVKVVVK